MSYILTGKLQGRVSPGRQEPLSRVSVRVYRVPESGSPVPKSGTSALTFLEVREKEYLWIGQATTNEAGEFTVDLTERALLGYRGSVRPYEGGPVQIDVCCRGLPGDTSAYGEEVQFVVTTFLPDWEQSGADELATFEFTLPQEEWGEIRTALDAWVISGRVSSRSTRLPLEGLRVLAFDADVLQDDALGSAITDAEGNFRIDFRGQLFRMTPVPKLEYEGRGPDLYFQIEAADGKLLVAEDRTRAYEPDRKDVQNLFTTELLVDL